MNKLLHTKAIVKSENVTEAGVVDMITGSSSVVDRMGDIIDQNGWDLKNFKANPVILWGHNVREERAPIGKAIKVWVEDKGKATARLMFKVQFDLADSFAAEIFRKVKDGFVNTVSVGFIPTEWEELDPENWFGGLKFLQQELLELSFVPVPANPEALVGLRSMAEKDKRFTPMEEKDFDMGKIKTKELIKELQHTKDVKEEKKETKDDTTDMLDAMGEHIGSMDKLHQSMKDKYGDSGKSLGEEETKAMSSDLKTMKGHADAISSQCSDMMGKEEDAAPEGEKKEESVSTDKSEEKEEEKEEEEKGEELTPEQEKEVMQAMFNTIRTKSGRVLSSKNENKLRQAEAILEEVLSAVDKAPEVDDEGTTKDGEEGKEEEKKEVVEEEVKGVIAYSDHGTAPESESWDGPGEMAKAKEPADWKAMCAWFDSAKPDDKGSYKLPHHQGDGEHKAVWKGVAAAMAALLGARGGVDIPDGDRKGVYNHLVKHYKEYDKEAPEFKMVEDQVLAGLDEELLALTLEREEKHVVRLIKKVLDNQKKEHNEKKKSEPTEEQQIAALKLLDKAFELTKNKLKEGGEK